MKVSATRKCLQAKKHVPIGGKGHHMTQSQNYMANHMIWLLGNRGSCGRDSSGKLTAVVMVTETKTETASFERFVTYSVFGLYS